MSGLPSDKPGGMPALATGATAEPSVRQKVRVTNLYATPWHLADGTAGHELPGFLDLGRLGHYYRLSADQLPRVLHRETLDADAVTFRRWQPVGAVTGAWAWLFQPAVGPVGGRPDRGRALRAGRGDRPARRLLLRRCAHRGNTDRAARAGSGGSARRGRRVRARFPVRAAPDRVRPHPGGRGQRGPDPAADLPR